MDILKDKIRDNYDYTSRYSSAYHYYNTKDDRVQFGIVKPLTKTVKVSKHFVKDTDTLDNLSLSYYGDPTYWWLIAYYNDIQDPFIRLIDHFVSIGIPELSGIYFEDLR